jgi:SsrA-binding protein
LEAGISLRGAEVKSCRAGKVTIIDSYVRVDKGEAFIHKLHIMPYDHDTLSSPTADRTRRLLLHKDEIRKLARSVDQKGMTLIPTKMYFRNGFVKVQVSLGKGKTEYDKRDTIKSRDAARDMRDAVRDYNRNGPPSARDRSRSGWKSSNGTGVSPDRIPSATMRAVPGASM